MEVSTLGGRHRTRWLQVSLRFLLFLTLVSGIVFAWYSQVEIRRRELIAEVKDLGGKTKIRPVGWFCWFSGSRVSDVSVPYNKVDQLDLDRLRLLPNLDNLKITNVNHYSNGTSITAAKITLFVDKVDGTLNVFGNAEKPLNQ